MYNAKQLFHKTVKLFPELGECGVDIGVTKDHLEKTWIVHLKKNAHKLDHCLELMDPDQCMKGNQCIALGLGIAQLRKSIDGKQF